MLSKVANGVTGFLQVRGEGVGIYFAFIDVHASTFAVRLADRMKVPATEEFATTWAAYGGVDEPAIKEASKWRWGTSRPSFSITLTICLFHGWNRAPKAYQFVASAP